MADQVPVKIHTFTVEIWGPPVFAHDSPEDFDAANQKMVDELEFGQIKDDIAMRLPAGYWVKF